MLHVSLAQSLPAVDDISVSTLKLHLTGVAAVSDRSSNDPRAQVSAADVDFGGTDDVSMPTAPPGIYSTVEWTLGDSTTAGIDLQGVAANQALHLQLISGPLTVRCDDPQSLAPGQRVQLTLSVDATHWFDGVDLSAVMEDEDDQGIILNMEDNAPLAIQILQNVINSFLLKCAPW